MRELPSNPNIAHLKKIAKNLLRQHRSGEIESIDFLKWLDRFKNCTDVEIRSAELSLHEVQQAIAMEYGFHSWDALKKYLLESINGSTSNKLPVPEKITDQWQIALDGLASANKIPAALIMRVVETDIKVFLSSRTKDNPYRPGDRETLLGSGLYCETVIATKDKLLVPNALKDPDWSANPDIELGMISYLGFPIIFPNGEIFGTICVLDRDENKYSTPIENLLLGFKSLVEAHLSLLHSNEALKKKNLQLEESTMQVRFLQGIVPICCHCQKIRTDDGNWFTIEKYLSTNSDTRFSHGICPSCYDARYPPGTIPPKSVF